MKDDYEKSEIDIREDSFDNINKEVQKSTEDIHEVDRIVVRRHTWQHAENELLMPDVIFLSQRPKSYVGNNEVLHQPQTIVAPDDSGDISDHVKSGYKEEIGLEEFDTNPNCKIAEDILIDVLENAVDAASSNQIYPKNTTSSLIRIEDENEALLVIENGESTHDDTYSNDLCRNTKSSGESCHHIQENKIDVSFRTNHISEIIDEIIDLTIKDPNICHVNVSNTNGMEYVNSLEKENVLSKPLHEKTPEEWTQVKTPESDIPKSVIDPINFKTILLQDTSNQSLDPRAISATHHILLNTPSSILALHLTKVDSNLFFLPTFKNNRMELLRRPMENLDQDDCEQNEFLSDVLERSMCLKTFVIVTIFTAMNVKESAKVCSKWIRIATHLKTKLGNLFGFYNMLSGLTANQLIQWGDLWIYLKKVCI